MYLSFERWVLLCQVGGCMDRSGGYSELVRTLDGCAAAEINAALEDLQPLTEPHVARELSKVLPTGAV